MDEQTFQEKLTHLLDRISDLPPEQQACMEQVVESTRGRRDRINDAVTEMRESLDFLRLSVKYLVFDHEATRRENTYLRRLLDQATRNRSESKDEHEDEDYGEY